VNIDIVPAPVAPFGYSYLIRGASMLQSLLLLAIRLYWGWQFAETGWGKLAHLDKVTGYFQSLGIPFPEFNVILAGSTEFIGGMMLFLGLGSRLICLPLIFTLIVAYLTTEQDALHSLFSDPDKFVTATPFEFMFAAIIVLVFGPGRFSLDYLIGKFAFGLHPETEMS
jgi:putative oxidoreductase